eukprot:CAMPEP_0178954198 /NCGR_PEP_ID=MMETSP0789-20121207/8853_1 /TAXON_ID=3005 /ORGANISM="Rhizosolenia setigera, Strain CCMP 1694" /LENGTH=469 /DNA_ID=CAMNT_0020635565 /DNA_START=315 /DNA_END=1724 /DNA_ORIENTATION=-
MKSSESYVRGAVMAALLFLTPCTLELNNMDHIMSVHSLSALAVEETTTTVSSDANKKTNDDTNYSLVKEVWSLVDKYYIDRSYNGQNWPDVLQKFQAQESLTPDSTSSTGVDEKNMKLVGQMVSSLGDKYSRMLDVPSYARIQKFDLIGVGVTLMPDTSNKRIMVGAPPVPGSASDRAGIKYGDYVDAVNGVPTKGRTAFDIIDQIGEDPNASSLSFTVRTQGPDDIEGEGFTRTVELERTFQKVNDPIYYKISETRNDGTTVGYVQIKEFNSLVGKKLEAALKDLEKQGANAYVLDLRGNPGGAFQSAVEISSFFMEDKVATYVVDNNAVNLPFKSAKGKKILRDDEPIAVWVDKRSASASEVFAGALHDNCRAVVMGETSFGKGLIQAVYGLKNGAGLVLTVANYVTPGGTDIQGVGIKPDLEGGIPKTVLSSYITVVTGDTSKVDFKQISSMTGGSNNAMCTIRTD